MVVIPPGKFRMGDIKVKHVKNDQPIHEVHIARRFAMSRYEISKARPIVAAASAGGMASRPRRCNALVPAHKAAGVASDNAHGQLTTSSAKT